MSAAEIIPQGTVAEFSSFPGSTGRTQEASHEDLSLPEPVPLYPNTFASRLGCFSVGGIDRT